MPKKSKKQRANARKTRASARPAENADTESKSPSGLRLRTESAPAPVSSESEVEEPVVAAAGDAVAAEEHRASHRVALAVDIHLASDSHFFSGLSGDISEGGLFLSTYRSLPVGSCVEIELSLPGAIEPVHARGEVRWVRDHSTGQPQGVGIAFDHLEDADRERVHRFCTMRPALYYEDVG